MPYFLVVALQIFCLYHAIKHKNDYYWFFVLIFVPGIGSIIYLAVHFLLKKDLNTIQNEIVNVVHPTKKVKDSRRQLNFADTFQNRVNLADALLESENYEEAIQEYEKALGGDHKNDIGVIQKLITAYDHTQQYDRVVYFCKKIKSNPSFLGSRSQFLYGMALVEEGNEEDAELHLSAINKRYCNYEERYLLAGFLLKKGKQKEAKDILSAIVGESEHMSKPNQTKYRSVIKSVKKLISTL